MHITEKLYESNSLLKECQAKVLACNKKDKGYEILLDRTVIFPEGGGQPSDKGWINDVRVSRAADRDGYVFHYCQVAFDVGSEVLVKLDWNERLDHMQQHCGEHMLSYAFWKLFGANNIGFHMNERSVFIDLDKEVSSEEVLQAEHFVNAEIWENRPITVSYSAAEALSDREMRKKNENIKGILRIVSVENGDACTCCGTHPPATGMVGILKVIGFDRHRGGMRIEFVCGRRALLDVRLKYDALAETNALLSVKPEEVPAAVRKLREELAEMTVRLKNKTLELYESRKEKILAEALLDSEGRRFVLIEEKDCSAKEAKLFAQVLTAEKQVTAGIFYRVAERLNYVLMSSADGLDCKLLCQKVNQLLNGKGGGNESFAQGSAAHREDWHKKIKELAKQL